MPIHIFCTPRFSSFAPLGLRSGPLWYYTLTGCRSVPLSSCHWNIPLTVTLRYFWTRTCMHNFQIVFLRKLLFCNQTFNWFYRGVIFTYSLRFGLIFERSWAAVTSPTDRPFNHGGMHILLVVTIGLVHTCRQNRELVYIDKVLLLFIDKLQVWMRDKKLQIMLDLFRNSLQTKSVICL